MNGLPQRPVLLGYVGLQGLGIFCVLAGIGFSVVTLPGFFYLASGSPDALFWLLAGWALTFVVTLAAFLVLMEVLKAVFLCAVFIYASEGVVPAPFDAEANVKSGLCTDEFENSGFARRE